jgi:hypothetical protein
MGEKLGTVNLLKFGKLNGYGTFFDELCLIMMGFDRGQWVSAAFSAGIAPQHRDGLIDLRDLALLAENWLWPNE